MLFFKNCFKPVVLASCARVTMYMLLSLEKIQALGPESQAKATYDNTFGIDYHPASRPAIKYISHLNISSINKGLYTLDA